MNKSVRNKLLGDIEKKADKIKERRKNATTVKSVDEIAFEFFSRADEAKEVAQVENKGQWINIWVVEAALKNMESQLSNLHDPHCKAEIIWDNGESPQPGNILGVKIYWSKAYCDKHSVEPVLYIDVTQILLV